METRTSTPAPPLRAATSGAVAAGVSLAVGEFFAGAVRGVPSAVSAVGSFVVDWAPPFMKDFAIAVFGTGDKAALGAGTVVIALLIGALVGRRAAHGFAAAVPWFVGFGVVGTLAGLAQPLVSVAPTVAVQAVSVAAGLGALRLLLSAARPAQAGAPGKAPDPARRRFVALLAGTGVAALAGAWGGRRLLTSRAGPAPEGLPPAAVPAGSPGPEASFPVPGLTPIVVPNSDFYRIDTALVVPRIDRADWRMRISGMVERPLELTLTDLEAMDLVERYVTLSCVSNRVGGTLVGNALWTGVPLAPLLEEAGIREGATQIVGRSVDDFTVGFPTSVAFDGRDPIIAIGMNGEPLPRDHGYPARLVVPGLYGYVSATKWLSEIELTTWEAFDAYWVPRGWAKEAPVKTQSRIDVPGRGGDVTAGEVVVAGVAWAPHRGISGVEVRVDELPWQEAELSVALDDDAWVQWRTRVTLAGGRHRLSVRATDGTGIPQTEAEAPPRPDGATGYHTITVDAA